MAPSWLYQPMKKTRRSPLAAPDGVLTTAGFVAVEADCVNAPIWVMVP